MDFEGSEEKSMEKKEFGEVAETFRKTIDEVLVQIGDIKDGLPPELKSTKEKINRLEKTMKKQKKVLEGFLG
jgi:hypothetical protein